MKTPILQQEMGKTLEGPGSFAAVQCDVSHEDDVTRLFKVINDEHKGVDVCINNAGINHGAATLLDGDTKQWAEMLNVRKDFCNKTINISFKFVLLQNSNIYRGVLIK